MYVANYLMQTVSEHIVFISNVLTDLVTLIVWNENIMIFTFILYQIICYIHASSINTYWLINKLTFTDIPFYKIMSIVS